MDAALATVLASVLALCGTAAGLIVQQRNARLHAHAKKVIETAQEKVSEVDVAFSAWKALAHSQAAELGVAQRQASKAFASEVLCQQERIALLRRIAELHSGT